MKNIAMISIIAFIYSAIVTAIAYIFFSDFAAWTLFGAAVSLFNHSLTVRFSKNKITKDVAYLLIGFKMLMYFIALGFMFYSLKENQDILMYSYLFFIVGAINIKLSIIIYHLPIKKFKQIRLEVEEGEHKDEGIS